MRLFPALGARHVAALAALAAGCGGGLDLNLVQGAHHEPSNVAVFFTVQAPDGTPVSGLTADDFRIYEDGAIVSISESRQTIVNPEVAAEHYTLLLVDMSGSVTESDQVPLIVQAATNFTGALGEYQKVAVYAFDGSADIHPIQTFTDSAGAGSRGVARLSSFRTRDPSTNLHGALVQATAKLNEAVAASTTPLKFSTVVVFTDGTDRASRVSYGEMMDALDESGADVFAIGVGNEIDEDTLASIGYSGYVLVADSAAITNAFDAISQHIVQYTQSHYLLSYCSPARAGEHDVTIEALVGEESGSLSYAFDATGFGPDCNPDTPPPFDTTGRGRPAQRRRPRSESGTRINVSGSARVSAGASANASAGGGGSAGGNAGANPGGSGGDPEAGDY